MSSPTQQTANANNNNQNNNANNNQNNGSGKSKGKQKKKAEKLELDLRFSNATTQNWATIMENDTENDVIIPSEYYLPEGPKALANEIDFSQIPSYPPFKAHIRNIHYDLEKEDLENLFRNLSVTNVLLNKEGHYHTAIVEFETKQDLIQAFEMNNKNFKGRNIIMSLGNDRGSYGGGDRGFSGDRRGRSGFGRDNTPNDWRSSRDAMPPKQVFPPPSFDPYDQQLPPRSGYSNRGGTGAPRGRYEDDYQQHRNDYARSGGTYDDRAYDDRYGLGSRNNDYGGRGNWGRSDHRNMVPPLEPEMDNWRHGAPPPPPPSQDLYEPPRGVRGSRYEDNVPPPRAMPRMTESSQSSYRNDNSYGEDYPRNQQVNDRSMMDHRNRSDLYDHRRSNEFRDERRQNDYQEQRLGHRNPPLMDHPPRERLPSTRSNLSIDQQSSVDEYQGGPGPQQPQQAQPLAPKERRPFINPSILGALVQKVSESNKPASYSSIFGEAKPVDTSKKEMEIEQKLLNMKLQPPPDSEPVGVSPPPPPGKRDDIVSGAPPSREQHYHRDQQDSIPPRHAAARRANGGIGGNRTGGVVQHRRDFEDRNNGALGDRRGPRVGSRDHISSGRSDRRDGQRGEGYGYSSGNDRRRYGDRDRIGGRRSYGDDMGSGSRYQNRVGSRSGYENDRNRYSSGSDYFEWSKEDIIKEDSKQINYATTNKFDHLGETEDHGSE